MGRNNHNKRAGGNFQKRKFDLTKIRVMVDRIQKSEDTPVILNAVLLFLPWALLFASGVLASPVYAYSNPPLDTALFVFGGIAVLGLVIVFALMLLPKRKGKK
jgi:hypothetical protein